LTKRSPEDTGKEKEQLMRMTDCTAALVIAGVMALPAQGADLTKIDRTIAREPAYKTRPRYGLLVFGPETKARVWLVLDGDVLYVDKNGNGDLTEKGERIKEERLNDQTNTFPIGELSLPEDRFPRNTSGLAILRDRRPGAAPGPLRLTITINQKTWLGTFHKLADRPRDAPILHFNFNGPLTFLCLSPPTFTPGKTSNLVIHIGTPGLGEKTGVWRSHASSIVGLQVALVAEIEYPNKRPGGRPLFARHILPLET
jgi:hypothetical protein